LNRGTICGFREVIKKKLKTPPESSKVDDFHTEIPPFKELRLPEKGAFLLF